ncbi:conserved hypothetical protein [[Clostridium] ultunense Esp]|uniref:hypothetical protein n=1 Tax=Thermicanus aegyptius TaxID=94009 RepID=UPI0002B70EC2|nr:hypothetical protein [Thermicanus aegyptius]CCQ95186.1 conserved hypothetical protein [[Clostridium] ultunense Esp]
MEAWLLFIKENFWGLLIVAIGLIIVLSIVKTMVKWVIVILVLAGVFLYGANFVGNIQDFGKQAVQYTKEQAVKLLIEEAKRAEYTLNKDGTYTIRSDRITLSGKIGSSEATLSILGQQFPIQLDETLKKVIQEIETGKK